MITRTYPYGTRKRVRLYKISVQHGSEVLLVWAEHLEDADEGTILGTILFIPPWQFDAIKPSPQENQERVMEFRQGGPTGGHWMILNGSGVAA
jgi:hypothetical protein